MYFSLGKRPIKMFINEFHLQKVNACGCNAFYITSSSNKHFVFVMFFKHIWAEEYVSFTCMSPLGAHVSPYKNLQSKYFCLLNILQLTAVNF